ncbi:GAF and ANTAR domain-containing protein [Kribbella sandramycini]|uniref:GAF and ANTAR domain-containing protein n=1 Tax=Kribbella sandramycini TaxID=60450 RepID=A0A7Y4KW34_9ACTN|nr:GAF and ANTAR domain-containing protein [Kribbella sandramycini]MBB6567602.1 GAF domain-containing protein [Kribbella sandramycini]NOL39795.1 GAF and ANTAR domain-containing protein [Kribbella sandramycini]
MPSTDLTSAHAFAELAGRLADLETVADVAETVCTAAAPLIGGGSVGLVLYEQRRFRLAGADDAVLAAAIDRQLVATEGPALDAARASAPVFADLTTTPLWSRWTPSACALGWRRWLSLPLMSRDQWCLGVLEVAGRTAAELGTAQIEQARVLAEHVAVAIDAARIRQTLLVAQIAQETVGQAVGILMERLDLTAEQAIGFLRRYSQEQHLKLRDVAAGLIATRKLPDPTGSR